MSADPRDTPGRDEERPHELLAMLLFERFKQVSSDHHLPWEELIGPEQQPWLDDAAWVAEELAAAPPSRTGSPAKDLAETLRALLREAEAKGTPGRFPTVVLDTDRMWKLADEIEAGSPQLTPESCPHHGADCPNLKEKR